MKKKLKVFLWNGVLVPFDFVIVGDFKKYQKESKKAKEGEVILWVER